MKKLYEINYFRKKDDTWVQCDAEGALVIGYHEALVIAENENPDSDEYYYIVSEVDYSSYLSLNGIGGVDKGSNSPEALGTKLALNQMSKRN